MTLKSSLALALTGFALASSAPIAAQSQLTFDISSAESSYSWGGNTSLGPVNTSPSNFSVDGILDLTLLPGSAPFTSGQFIGAPSYAIPKVLSGQIPSPLPFVPPIASFSLVDSSFKLDSAVFPINAANGSFNTAVVLTGLNGVLTYNISGLSTGSIPLADAAGDPTPISGTITQSGNVVTRTAPININIDVGSLGIGVTGSVFLNGTLVARTNLVDPPARLDVANIIAGQVGSFTFSDGLPGNQVALLYSFNGPGSASFLGVTLGLADSTILLGPNVTDGTGGFQWSLPIPASVSGVGVWLQALQPGLTSNVVPVTVG